jgi:hypothetical protein
MTLCELIGVLIAAGGPVEIDTRFAWPLHAALRLMFRCGNPVADVFPAVTFSPSPSAGEAAEGTGDALLSLAEEGVLSAGAIVDGPLILRVTSDMCIRPYRKLLLGLPLEAAELTYRAATNWRTRAATAAKTFAIARASSRAMSTLGTPKVCHLPTAEARC